MYVIQTNGYALIIELVLLVSMLFKRDFSYQANQRFYWMLILTSSLLILDTLSELSNGLTSPSMRVLHPVSTALLFSLSGFIALTWWLYVWHHLYPDKPIKQTVYRFLWAPSLLIVVFSVYSLFARGIFYMTDQNIYMRGPFFLWHAAVLYGYVMATFVLIVLNYKSLKRNDFLALLSIPLFPLVGGTVQIFIYGVLLLWPMTALSLLVVYLFIQSNMSALDVLTKVYNRREYEHHLSRLAKRTPNKGFGVILFDIQNFKTINDTYGHQVGDDVLRAIGEVLIQTFDPDKTIYRVGGDEFIVFVKQTDKDALTALVERVEQQLHRHQAFTYPIILDYGFDVYDPSMNTPIQAFIHKVDQTMYAFKKRTTKP